MAITEITVSKIYVLATEPTNKVKDRFWFDTTNNILKKYNGTTWKPISVSSDDVAVLTDGSKVSLTSYLNTQIAAVVEGIDSKQDKLLYYSEVSGDTPSATISVGNIKLGGSVAEGIMTTASGQGSHAEGSQTTAQGNGSHAEGLMTTASNSYSHAEGNRTTASGIYSHAEGDQTTASGQGSHAEGSYTTASGRYSHAEGYQTRATEDYSHAEGEGIKASSDWQHAQGKWNIEDVNKKYADIIGNGSSNSARSNAATVSWDGISWSQTDVRAGGTNQDAAAHSLSAKQNATDNTLTTTAKTVVGAINELATNKQHTLNYYSETSGDTPSATISVANIKLEGSVAEGYYTTASGNYSHAEGVSTTASGIVSHAEGDSTTASGSSSHAEGGNTTALGSYSHAEGYHTTASGSCSHAEGNNTKASSDSQHVQGKYNIEDTENKYADIIGNGSSSARSNAATVSWTGITWSQSDVRAGGTDQDNAIHSLSAKQNATDNTLTTTAKTVVGAINEVNTALGNKQDNLLYYSETSGETPSATITVANIKLNCSVAEGNSTVALGSYSHAEGIDTIASGQGSHAEGYSTTASGNYSHAEGDHTTASEDYSHAEGSSTTASGISSHAEGSYTTASSTGSHAEGYYTKTSSNYQHAQGQYNIEDADNKYADIIGNGSADDNRSNAQTVSWDGITWSQTDVRAGGTDQDSAAHSLSNKQDKLLYYSETSGNITISAEDTNAQDKQGGTINISAGDNTSSSVPNSGGSITLNGGTPSSTGGTAILLGGSGTQSGGGMVIANGGNGGTGGNISIQAGGGMGGKGNIILGNANFLYLNSEAIGGSLVDSTISSSSLNTHIPTSKAVYDAITKTEITTLTSGESISLNSNTFNKLTINQDFSFTLPSITDNNSVYQITVYLNITSSDAISINWGTTHFFNNSIPTIEGNSNYNVIYEYDCINSYWVCGVIQKS